MPAQRWLIWQLHLPAAYAIEQRLMELVAALCASSADRFANAEGRAVIKRIWSRPCSAGTAKVATSAPVGLTQKVKIL